MASRRQHYRQSLRRISLQVLQQWLGGTDQQMREELRKMFSQRAINLLEETVDSDFTRPLRRTLCRCLKWIIRRNRDNKLPTTQRHFEDRPSQQTYFLPATSSDFGAA